MSYGDRFGSVLVQEMACCWHQAIIWTNTDLPSEWSSENHLRAISQEIYLCHKIVKLASKLIILNLGRNHIDVPISAAMNIHD